LHLVVRFHNLELCSLFRKWRARRFATLCYQCKCACQMQNNKGLYHVSILTYLMTITFHLVYL